MSAESPSYNKLYVQAWTLLSLIVSLVLLGMFIFGQTFLHAGHWIWDLIRYLASPII